MPRHLSAPHLRLTFLLQFFGAQALGFLGKMLLLNPRPFRMTGKLAAISLWSGDIDAGV